MNFEEHIPLKDLTTFRIGGEARYFVRISHISDLQISIVFARSRNIPIFILGGGSNIVVSDEGFPGLVVKIEIAGIDFNLEKESKVIVSAGAGENWDAFVAETVAQGLHGLENLSLIPGTVGATPVQNIGAYGVEVKDTIAWVEALDTETGVMRHFLPKECEFRYRSSIFKKPEGKKYIITRVGFALEKVTAETKLSVQYKDIVEYIKNNNLNESEITIQQIRDMVIDIRTKKLPNLKELGTAGSFFKNPIVSEKKYAGLLKKFPELPGWVSAPFKEGVADLSGQEGWGGVKIPAAWILDNICGFKGYREGDVGVYKNQALVLVNYGNATAADIKNLAQKMINAVKEKTGIILEREVEYIG